MMNQSTLQGRVPVVLYGKERFSTEHLLIGGLVIILCGMILHTHVVDASHPEFSVCSIYVPRFTVLYFISFLLFIYY